MINKLVDYYKIDHWVSVNQYVTISWQEWLEAPFILKEAWVAACNKVKKMTEPPPIMPKAVDPSRPFREAFGSSNVNSTSLSKYFS